jgi:hypothetical protein
MTSLDAMEPPLPADVPLKAERPVFAEESRLFLPTDCTSLPFTGSV